MQHSNYISDSVLVFTHTKNIILSYIKTNVQELISTRVEMRQGTAPFGAKLAPLKIKGTKGTNKSDDIVCLSEQEPRL